MFNPFSRKMPTRRTVLTVVLMLVISYSAFLVGNGMNQSNSFARQGDTLEVYWDTADSYGSASAVTAVAATANTASMAAEAAADAVLFARGSPAGERGEFRRGPAGKAAGAGRALRRELARQIASVWLTLVTSAAGDAFAPSGYSFTGSDHAANRAHPTRTRRLRSSASVANTQAPRRPGLGSGAYSRVMMPVQGEREGQEESST